MVICVHGDEDVQVFKMLRDNINEELLVQLYNVGKTILLLSLDLLISYAIACILTSFSGASQWLKILPCTGFWRASCNLGVGGMIFHIVE